MKRLLVLLPALTLALLTLPAAPAVAATCTVPLGGGCGAYNVPSFWPGSNGYNTYVNDQDVGAQSGSTGSLTASGPSRWLATADYVSCGGCVQTYTAAQQLTNNWGSGGFNGGSDMPMAALSVMWINYTETSPSGAGSQYEFSPDLWTNYPSDVMMWADTSPVRCSGNGLGAGDIIGQANLNGQAWTVYRNGGPGSEIIFILDTTSTDPVTTGTCAQQKSGTFHIVAALRWLSGHLAGFPSWASLTMGQFDCGWEITDADGTGTFTVSKIAPHVGIAS